MRAACLLLIASLACIERPYQGSQPQQRTQVDRNTLRDVLVAPPADLTPVGAVFGNAAELIGYKLEPPQLIPGQRSRLTFYWRCRAELEPWHVFVHLDDANGTGQRIHADHDPANGRFPTDAWRPGDVIADSILFVPGPDALALYLGFYSQGEARLPVTNAGRGRDDGQSRLLAGILPIAR